ncbi:hypothetical protein B0H67DRAFT_492588 [Lasiosphaeris hirsuta]|uniref:Uncharacterized protein n=1 Tax=Lasiosphaeris hirsuta TaxID=260670 RepID=A0AA40A791_9PEZI|nr:hypothetical protein B0H67DRAFT_492588 [Lasiosphaeris hirsuta]
MGLLSLVQSQPRLLGGLLSLGVLGVGTAFLSKRKLDQTYPSIPLHALPKASACRNLIENGGETTSRASWGLSQSTILSSWSGSDEKTHWIPSFVAIQAEIPISALEKYRAKQHHPQHETDTDGGADEPLRLAQNLVAAFLDARGAGPDSWLLDKDVPPLSFCPGTRLFGNGSGLGAFLLGVWSSATGRDIRPQTLPGDVAQPLTRFPSNRTAVAIAGTESAAAGAVMYWKVPDATMRAVDRAAVDWLPWRLMQGGYQEWMVEKISGEMARVVYVSVECAQLFPRGRSKRDFRRVPWLVYELHALYTQYLLFNAVRYLNRQ